MTSDLTACLPAVHLPHDGAASAQVAVLDEDALNAPAMPMDDIPIDDQGNYIRSVTQEGRQLIVDGPEAQTMGVRKAAQLQQQWNQEGLNVRIIYRGSDGVLIEACNAMDLAAIVERLPEALGTSR